MAALDEILATIRRLPLPERLQLIERATLEAAEDSPSAPAVSVRTRTLSVDEFLAVRLPRSTQVVAAKHGRTRRNLDGSDSSVVNRAAACSARWNLRLERLAAH